MRFRRFRTGGNDPSQRAVLWMTETGGPNGGPSADRPGG
ncbi:hypothetical protein ATKI12_0058 [Kitasatospora sp. Ki12]